MKTYRKDGNNKTTGKTYCKDHFIEIYRRSPNILDTAHFFSCSSINHCDGDCDELLIKWQNKENMQEYATLNYLKKWAGKPSSSLKDFSFKGYEVIEKTVKPHSTSAHVGLPISWTGCRVAVVRLDEGSESTQPVEAADEKEAQA